MQSCIVCGKSYISERQRKYCSSVCLKKEWRQRNRGKDLEQRRAYNKRHWQRVKQPLLEKKCALCETLFTPNKHTPHQPYCSPKCRLKSYYESHHAQIMEQKKRERLKNKERYHVTNLAYKDMMRYSGKRERVFIRDNYTCQECGAKDKELLIHHKDGSGQSLNPNNKMHNLQTLCRACHMRIHKPLKQSLAG